MALEVGDTSLIALDWRLAALQAPLAWCLGLDAIAAVDRALGLVHQDGPLLLTGPRGCDQEWLARRIHDASGRREHPFTAFTSKLPRGADALLAGARWGTVFVDLATVGKVSKAFAARLFAGDTSSLRLRPIISATSHVASQRAFEDLAQTQMLPLPPLASRRDEVPRLFDYLMAEHGSRARIRDLGAPRVERLIEHDWPSNLDELREAERRLRALIEGGNKTQAAKRIGSSRQALDKFLRRIFHD
jgi:transcriptional regulator with AAA-type ATPase domain